MTAAELSYKMCPTVPPIQCTKGHKCVFHYQAVGEKQKECHISKNAHRQRVSAHVNNPQNTKRQWTLAAQIENE